MKRFSIICVAWATSLTSVAWADPAKVDRAPMVYQDQKGVWLRSDVLKHMTTDLEAYKGCKDTGKLLEEKLSLKDNEISVLYQTMEASDEQTKNYKKSFEAMSLLLNSARAESNRWYRKPALWYGLGVLTSVVIVVAVAYAIH